MAELTVEGLIEEIRAVVRVPQGNEARLRRIWAVLEDAEKRLQEKRLQEKRIKEEL